MFIIYHRKPSLGSPILLPQVFAVPGEEVRTECASIGTPIVDVAWYKDVEVMLGGVMLGEVMLGEGNVRLTQVRVLDSRVLDDAALL